MHQLQLKIPQNYEARAALMQASSFGCCGLLNIGRDFSPWPVHGIEHEVSAYTDITHGARSCHHYPKMDALFLK